jgi:hypothetical protein
MNLDDHALRSERMRSQRLSGDRPPSVAVAIRAVVGVQAQDLPAAELAVRARSAGTTRSDVTHARVRLRSVVWTWAMRGTLHLVGAEDVRWLLSLLGPPAAAAAGRRRAELGFPPERAERAVAAILRLLADHGPHTRAQLVEALAAEGFDASGQAAAHLLHLAAMRGLVCRGPEIDGEAAYVLLDDWVDPSPIPDRARAVAELVLRYLDGYGPASPPDLANFAGLPVSLIREGWRQVGDSLTEVDTSAGSAWMRRATSSAVGRPTVRLLPGFDTYLMGYRTRHLAVAPQHARRVLPGGGWIHPTVAMDGRVVGVWKLAPASAGRAVTVDPFEHLDEEVEVGISEETADIGRFLGEPLVL